MDDYVTYVCVRSYMCSNRCTHLCVWERGRELFYVHDMYAHMCLLCIRVCKCMTVYDKHDSVYFNVLALIFLVMYAACPSCPYTSSCLMSQDPSECTPYGRVPERQETGAAGWRSSWLSLRVQSCLRAKHRKTKVLTEAFVSYATRPFGCICHLLSGVFWPQ